MGLFGRKAGRIFGAVGAVAVLFAGAGARAQTEAEPSILFPDVWGARLPGPPDQPSREVATWIAGDSGDVAIEYTVAPQGWTAKGPRVERIYSFFRNRLVFSQGFADEAAMRGSDDLRRVRAASSPAADTGLLFLYAVEPGRPIRESFARLIKRGGRPKVDIDGWLEARALFDAAQPSLFGPNYALVGDTGEILADKVFVEIFDRPRSIAPRSGADQPAEAERWKNVQAVGLAFRFYPLPDGTLLGVDAERRIAVRFDARLDSPFFARDGQLAAVDGERFREWIVEARTRAAPAGKTPTADAIDRYLARRIVAAGRSRK